MRLSNIASTFKKCRQEHRPALLTYTVSGDPNKKKSFEILKAISSHADICEIGVGHNCNTGDGKQIQNSTYRAIKNGIKIKDTFAIVKKFKKTKNAKPCILMGYYNSVVQYGENRFVRKCKQVGVDGLIIVDLPWPENRNFSKKCRQERRPALLTYTVSGDPNKKKSFEILKAISSHADICEIGVGHNCNTGDGKQIQNSTYRAIKNGIKIKDTFAIVKKFKKTKNAKPCILMGYYNSVVQYGENRFVRKCKQVGVDGLIIVDLPWPENRNFSKKCRQERRPALLTYTVSGDPNKKKSFEILKAISSHADICEIGVGHNCNTGDGKQIQNSTYRAIKNGIKIKDTFTIVKKFKKTKNAKPCILMGYYNSVVQYGENRFIKKCKQVGVDGLIVVDLPWPENKNFSKKCKKNSINFVQLVSPTTSSYRMKRIINDSHDMIYYISMLSTTGGKLKVSPKEILKNYNKIKKINKSKNLVIGFGITIKTISSLKKADGLVVGSALCKRISESIKKRQNPVTNVGNMVKRLRIKLS